MGFIKHYFKGYHEPGGMKGLLVMALPMMVSTSCDAVMTFTDRFFLAKLGTEYMNAAMGGFVTYQTLIFFFMGLVGYSTALVAQYYGADQKHQAPLVTTQGMLLSILAWPIILLLKPLAVYAFSGVHLPENQLVLQVEYLNILVLGSMLTLFRQVLGCYFTGIGQAQVVMRATLSALIVNVALDYVLIFGKFGFPAMGIQGAALATVAGNAVSTFYFLGAYFKRKNLVAFQVLKSFRINGNILRRLIRYGYPAGVEMSLNFIAFFFITLMFQSQGPSESTATSVMFSYDMLSFIPLLGIEIATTSLAGRYMGAETPDYAVRTAWSAAKLGLLYSVIVLIIFLSVPGLLVNVFEPRAFDEAFQQARPMAMTMIRLASLYVLAQAVMIALIGTLRGAGDTFYTMLVSVGGNWIFVPLQYVLLYKLHASIQMAWLGLILVYLVLCIIIYRRFIQGKWKSLRIIN